MAGLKERQMILGKRKEKWCGSDSNI